MIAEGESEKNAQPVVNGGIMCSMLTKRPPYSPGRGRKLRPHMTVKLTQVLVALLVRPFAAS